jgi:ankyrin repeat protein
MSRTRELHDAVRNGDLARLTAILGEDVGLANSISPTDARGTHPLHVAAEFGQAEAAQLLLRYGADPSLLDAENDAIPLGWAAFFGRPAVVAVLLEAGSDPSQRNKHGLTPLACAVGGTQGKWQQFSKATAEEWRRCADLIRAHGGVE